eukprot:gene19799-23714_t
MRAVILVVLLFVALAAAKKFSTEEIKFRQFQSQFNKQYTSAEYAAKFATFKSNLNRINALNLKAQDLKSSAYFGVNEFADLSVEEFAKYYLNSAEHIRDPAAPVAADLPVDALPATYDWATLGAVTPVKNQGQCGSCWSFSTTGNVEGQWKLAGNTLVGLSEQNLVDCDHECMEYEGQQSCDQGCDGGLQPNAYQYIISNNGIDTEASYTYTAETGTTCNFNAANIGAKISNWTYVSSNETQMAAYLVANGPLAIAADAAEWQFYLGGVFDFPCGKILDHGILITGYGSETNAFGKVKPYWIIKNSWGASWGKAGYLWVERGTGEAQPPPVLVGSLSNRIQQLEDYYLPIISNLADDVDGPDGYIVLENASLDQCLKLERDNDANVKLFYENGNVLIYELHPSIVQEAINTWVIRHCPPIFEPLFIGGGGRIIVIGTTRNRPDHCITPIGRPNPSPFPSEPVGNNPFPTMVIEVGIPQPITRLHLKAVRYLGAATDIQIVLGAALMPIRPEIVVSFGTRPLVGRTLGQILGWGVPAASILGYKMPIANNPFVNLISPIGGPFTNHVLNIQYLDLFNGVPGVPPLPAGYPSIFGLDLVRMRNNTIQNVINFHA